ncbi:Uncharacterized protein HZ326_29971, partial [Fusarium oxysporum f. sp. albedinis]
MPKSRLRWKYTEEDMAEAILDVTDDGFSPPQAAHRRGVPRNTLIDRLNGRGAVKEQIHPHRRLSKSQEDRLALWILRQESLGYAPSHSQIRACVMGLLRQQGERPNLGRNWGDVKKPKGSTLSHLKRFIGTLISGRANMVGSSLKTPSTLMRGSILDEYYSLLGQSPLYPAAVIFHPRWNASWLEANWTSDEQLVWLRDAENSVREFFEQHYPREEQPEPSRTVTGKAVRPDEPSQFDQWMQSCDRCMMEEEDELGVYMRQRPVRRENLNPVLWWKDHQEDYPRLSKFAFDILAIPAMSVDPERTFSATKLTVSSQRHSISPEIIEEMQCLRNWLRHQAITVGEVVSFGGDLVGW